MSSSQVSLFAESSSASGSMRENVHEVRASHLQKGRIITLSDGRRYLLTVLRRDEDDRQDISEDLTEAAFDRVGSLAAALLVDMPAESCTLADPGVVFSPQRIVSHRERPVSLNLLTTRQYSVTTDILRTEDRSVVEAVEAQAVWNALKDTFRHDDAYVRRDEVSGVVRMRGPARLPFDPRIGRMGDGAALPTAQPRDDGLDPDLRGATESRAEDSGRRRRRSPLFTETVTAGARREEEVDDAPCAAPTRTPQIQRNLNECDQLFFNAPYNHLRKQDMDVTLLWWHRARLDREEKLIRRRARILIEDHSYNVDQIHDLLQDHKTRYDCIRSNQGLNLKAFQNDQAQRLVSEIQRKNDARARASIF